jgi:hypothetical protein
MGKAAHCGMTVTWISFQAILVILVISLLGYITNLIAVKFMHVKYKLLVAYYKIHNFKLFLYFISFLLLYFYTHLPAFFFLLLILQLRPKKKLMSSRHFQIFVLFPLYSSSRLLSTTNSAIMIEENINVRLPLPN